MLLFGDFRDDFKVLPFKQSYLPSEATSFEKWGAINLSCDSNVHLNDFLEDAVVGNLPTLGSYHGNLRVTSPTNAIMPHKWLEPKNHTIEKENHLRMLEIT